MSYLRVIGLTLLLLWLEWLSVVVTSWWLNRDYTRWLSRQGVK